MSHETHTVGVFLPEGIEAEVCADIARRQAAAKYGVWPSTASDALSGRTWPERSFFTGLIAANRPWSQRA